MTRLFCLGCRTAVDVTIDENCPHCGIRMRDSCGWTEEDEKNSQKRDLEIVKKVHEEWCPIDSDDR